MIGRLEAIEASPNILLAYPFAFGFARASPTHQMPTLHYFAISQFSRIALMCVPDMRVLICQFLLNFA